MDVVRPSVVSAASQARSSKLSISNMAGGLRRVTAVSITTVTIADETGVLDTTPAPGGATTNMLLEIIKGVADADRGKLAVITAIAAISGGTRVLTVSADLSTVLAADSVVAVIPPMEAEVRHTGHTLDAVRAFAEDMGVGDQFDLHNSPMAYMVGGDIPFPLTRGSEAVGRLLMFGTGSYIKSAASTHDYYPVVSAFAGTSTREYASFASREANLSAAMQFFLSLYATRMVLDFPADGPATGLISTMGGEYVREIGGTGKTVNAVSGTYPSTPAEGGESDQTLFLKRHCYRGVVVGLGGSLGDSYASATTIDPYFSSATVTIDKPGTDDKALGASTRVRPIEERHQITVTGRRILENETVIQKLHGQDTNDTPEPQIGPVETRLFVAATDPGDAAKQLIVDIPRGIFTAAPIVRQRGRFVQDYTFRGLHTLSAQAPAAATPLYRLRYKNGDDVDYAANV